MVGLRILVEWFHLLEFQVTKTIVFGDVMVAM